MVDEGTDIAPEAAVRRMRLVGGRLALDFANTRSGPPDGPADDDVLTGYPALLAWAAYVGMDAVGMDAVGMDAVDMDAVGMDASPAPRGGAPAFAEALRLRDALDSILRSLAHGTAPSVADLRALRDAAAQAAAHAELMVDAPGGYAWNWQGDRCSARPLHLVAHSAVELLRAGPTERIKQCEGCSFLFFDDSKNRSRRWCSMEDCGGEAKMRRYIEARRARSTSHL